MAFAPIKYLPENKTGRDFIVGDLHGCYHLLEKAMQQVRFSTEKDRIICVGDLINRGPDSIRCLEFLGQPWFHAVRGNHEQFYIDAYEKAGMRVDDESLTEDGAWLASVSSENREILYQKFIALPFVIETDTSKGKIGIVHADIPKKHDWQTFKKKIEKGHKKTIDTAIYGRARIEGKIDKHVKGVSRIFLGHTIQTDGPTRLGNCFFIDTGAYKGYALTFAETTLEKSAYKLRKNSKTHLNLIIAAEPEPALLTKNSIVAGQDDKLRNRQVSKLARAFSIAACVVASMLPHNKFNKPGTISAPVIDPKSTEIRQDTSATSRRHQEKNYIFGNKPKKTKLKIFHKTKN